MSNELKSNFPNNTYDTPKNKRRHILDKLFLNTRWFFVGGYVAEIFRSRSLSLKEIYDRQEWAASSYRIFQLIEKCGGKFHISGLDNIRSCTGPVVFISNHMSTLETFVFPCLIAPEIAVTFVVKDSLVRHRIFGPIMRARNPIVVGRKNPREDLQTVMTEGKNLLTNGTSLIIFPQSTRTSKFNPEEFNSLGIKLAKTSGVQVVPVAIKTDFWGNGKILKDIGPIDRKKHIYMDFGKPFKVEGTGKEDHEKIVAFIVSRLNNWKNMF